MKHEYKRYNPLEVEEMAKGYFTQYVLYFNESRTERMCFCTNCLNWFSASKASDVYLCDEAFSTGHKGKGNCPCCDACVTYIAGGRITNGKSLEETRRLVHIHVPDENTVVLRAFYVVSKFYNAPCDFVPTYELEIKAKYILHPGEAHCFFNNEAFTENEHNMREVNVREPYSSYMYSVPSYVIMNIDDLAPSFLRYHQWLEFRDRCSNGPRARYVHGITYFCRLAEYPQIEFLINNEAYEWVYDLVYRKVFENGLVDWKQRSMAKFFRMTKPWANAFAALAFDKRILRLWHEIGKALDISAFVEQANFLGKRTFVNFYYFCKDKDIDSIAAFSYLKKRSIRGNCGEAFTAWRDYIAAAKAIGLDLTNHNVCFPKALFEAHDTTVACREVANRKVSKKELAALKERRLRYAYEDERFSIVFPMTVKDIVAEGRMQSNCVAGYADRHLKGTTTILFLREKERPNEAFYTIEVREGRIVQCYGFKNEVWQNCRTDFELKRKEAFFARDRDAAMRFKDEWWCWVCAGSPRNANGVPVKLSKAEEKAV